MYDNFTEHGPNYWYIDAGDGPEILGADDFKLELTSLGSLSILGASVVAGSLAVSAGVGSYCKCAIYQYMYNKAKETEIKPIDILILVNAITQNLICLFLAVFYSRHGFSKSCKTRQKNLQIKVRDVKLFHDFLRMVC